MLFQRPPLDVFPDKKAAKARGVMTMSGSPAKGRSQCRWQNLDKGLQDGYQLRKPAGLRGPSVDPK